MTGSHKPYSNAIRASLMLALGLGWASLAQAHITAVTLLGGVGQFDFGHAKEIVFPPVAFRTDTFNINGHSLNAVGGLGVTFYNIPVSLPAYDVDYIISNVAIGANFYYNQTTRHGTVLEYGLPSFNNSIYRMNVESGRLMLDAEVDFYPVWRCVNPFLELGAGLAGNAMSFKNIPVPVTGVSGGGYQLPEHTVYRFAYEAGGGLNMPLSKHFTMSARYLYANSGHAESSKHATNGVSLGSRIKIVAQSQSVLLGISYLIG